MPRDFDLFVIGAGSGGVRASRMAASYGARVAVAEERYLGGTCVNAGCIPKKLLVYASHFGEDARDAAGYGWQISAGRFDWSVLLARKDEEIRRLNRVYAELLDRAGVERIEGRARLVDGHTVEVAGRRLTAEHVLVATGSWPSLPPTPGVEHAITSNEAFHLKQLPGSVVVVGGGYVAVEFAGIFHGLGAEVTQLYRGPLFLRGFDDDVRRFLADEMRKRGVGLRFDTDVTRIERSGDGLRVTTTGGDTLEAEAVLYATGRRPMTADLGLERAGVALGPNGEIRVDAYSRTNVPGIWAIGDVTDRLTLTPVAIHEAMAFSRTAFGGEPTRPDHAGVPTAVFSQPGIASVGLTEAEARARHDDVDVYRASFRPLLHTLSERDERALVKVVVQRASERVLGFHMVGRDAGEVVQGLAVALKSGVTKAQLDATVGIHPTTAEEFVSLREAAA